VVDQAHPENLPRPLEELGDEAVIGAGGDVAGGLELRRRAARRGDSAQRPAWAALIRFR
jgi:ribulose 1,5-bisphosphate carboxylase large subunit-like protein